MDFNNQIIMEIGKSVKKKVSNPVWDSVWISTDNVITESVSNPLWNLVRQETWIEVYNKTTL